MTRLAMLRHGRTAWNEDGRLQGRTDIALSAAGRAALEGRAIPAPYRTWPVWCSPLQRARETAEILGLSPLVEPLLTELDFGAWEGRTLADLRAAIPTAMAANEARGLDMQPPGGESPRQVQQRLAPLLARLAEGPDTLAIAHKGVIRAIFALAHDWDYQGKPPVRLDWSCLHIFALGPGGTVRPDRMNLPLDGRA